MGRPSRRILDLREAVKREIPYYAPPVFDELAEALAVKFDVTPEVALTQVKRVHYQLTHGGKAPHRGQANDTALHLGPTRCAWLKAHGGKQPAIKQLVDEAMNDVLGDLLEACKTALEAWEERGDFLAALAAVAKGAVIATKRRILIDKLAKVNSDEILAQRVMRR